MGEWIVLEKQKSVASREARDLNGQSVVPVNILFNANQIRVLFSTNPRFDAASKRVWFIDPEADGGGMLNIDPVEVDNPVFALLFEQLFPPAHLPAASVAYEDRGHEIVISLRR